MNINITKMKNLVIFKAFIALDNVMKKLLMIKKYFGFHDNEMISIIKNMTFQTILTTLILCIFVIKRICKKIQTKRTKSTNECKLKK